MADTKRPDVGVRKLLVANRGEVAARIARSARELGVVVVGVRTEDDADRGHVRFVDEVTDLPGRGAAAYLDVEAVVEAAARTGCDALHPGYGFLAERPDLAERCEADGLTFVGPTPATLAAFGDKLEARALAARLDVPVIEAAGPLEDAAEIEAFWGTLAEGSAVVVKARGGGGGRGVRVVADRAGLAEAVARARSEARGAFGDGGLYVERLVRPARHVEVQVVGDGRGGVTHLGTRDCSLQRRRQKVVEIAPAPGLGGDVESRLTDAAVRIAAAVDYRGVGTVEYLVDGDGGVHFLEVNPRLQVEHTVTEEVHGVDLVAVQLRIAGGARLDGLGLTVEPLGAGAEVRGAAVQVRGAAVQVRGAAVQVRVNAERVGADGAVRPSTGRLVRFEPPGGPGVRVDTAAAAGDDVTVAFDPLLAKIVTWSPEGVAAALRRAERACREFAVEGVATNLDVVTRLLARPDVREGRLRTTLLDEALPEIVAEARSDVVDRRSEGEAPTGADGASDEGVAGKPGDTAVADRAEDSAVDDRAGDSAVADRAGDTMVADQAGDTVVADLAGVVVSLEAGPGDLAPAGSPLLVLESMKMEHVVAAPRPGRVAEVLVAVGDHVTPGTPLVVLPPEDVDADAASDADEVDLDAVRPDLVEVLDRQRLLHDEARPDAVARRRRHGRRTARENLEGLVDPGTFTEYGGLAVAAQQSRRDLDELRRETPADGLVGGTAHVNGDLFGDERSRCAVMSYDYTVLAGTQGYQGHRKKDRLFALAERLGLPVVLFAEGGGGRPGDVDAPAISGLDTMAFALFARLSGQVPLVGIASGRCFAGNAALLGCCDVIIATRDASIGMAGPAMIEGGGLGAYRPEEIGPVEVQAANGVIDVVADDDAEAVAVARRYLAFAQGPVDDWECADQRLLRSLVPENRVRVYDVRRVVETLADTGSTLELRRGWAPGIVTTLARVEGRPVGIVANDPRRLGGAIDADGADKAARFLQLCDAYGLPVVFLCDTPGFMVGPEAERQAQVRHFARLFVVGAALDVPFGTVVLRKGYGLGAQAMAGGSFHAPVFTVAWPTGEIGAMGLEGAVRLGFRRELDAAPDEQARQALFEELVAAAYERGKALHAATAFELDDVIDPAATRERIVAMLRAAPPRRARTTGRARFVDTW